MSKIAIAGGSDGIGGAICRAIEADETHEFIILSRREGKDSRVVAVNYSDINELTEVLNDHNVHTVISALSIHDNSCGQAQMNLIEASVLSNRVKRFIPSEFGAKYNEEAIHDIPAYAWKFKAVDRLRNSDLEYTQFSNGMFMDYWFEPRIKSAFSVNLPSIVDLGNNFAAIPGDGNSPMVLTHSRDIGQFVVQILSLPRWESRYYLVGDRITVNEFVAMAEEACGSKFDKCFDAVESLENGECTPMPAVKQMLPEGEVRNMVVCQMALAAKRITKGGLDLPLERTLNELFPELETLKVREALGTYFNVGYNK